MATSTRRTVLALGTGAVLAAGAGVVATQVDPVRRRVRRTLGVGRVEASAPAVDAGTPVLATFDSAARGREVTWGWAVPPGSDPAGLPVLLVLHGRGDDARAAFTGLGVHRFLAAHVAAGGAPFAVASVDGGSSYWHPRADGDDPPAMLRDELLPRLAGTGFDLGRWAVAGWSMGGFGALLLARESAAGRFGGPGDLVTAPGTGDVADSVSCGVDDPFRAQTEAYRAACDPAPAGGIGDGDHSMGYWRSLVPGWLDLAGHHLVA